VIREADLIKRLQARVECEGKYPADRLNSILILIATLAPHILKIIREEVAEARRKNQ
jgi:hypothetical protein